MLAAALAAHAVSDRNAFANVAFWFTLTASSFAHVFGYLAYRQFDDFPGLTSKNAVLPTFLTSYAAVLFVILMLRIDYSRIQMLLSFIVSVSSYWFLDASKFWPISCRLAVVPGGKAERLSEHSGISWIQIESPSSSLPSVVGVVADLRADLPDEWERFIASCALSGLPVYHVERVIELLTGKVEIEHLSENTLGSVNPNSFIFSAKRTIDWLIALVLLLFLLPLFVVIAVAVRLESPGPIFFIQERVGYLGRSFRVYKFRTMRHRPLKMDNDDEGEFSRSVTLDSDPRITRIGSFLRRSRIDELPQIFNILRGEMSWIGPRPEAIALSRFYDAELPFYKYRHIMRPGITGWAQVNQGHVTHLDDVRTKLHYDFYYIKNFSLSLEIAIVLRTFGVIVSGFGAR